MEKTMRFEPEGYFVIRERLTYGQILGILGKPEYGPIVDTTPSPPEGEPCGLPSSQYRIMYCTYTDWQEPEGSLSARVCIHPDGVCFSGLNKVVQDWDFARKLFMKVVTELSEFQSIKYYTYRKYKSPQVVWFDSRIVKEHALTDSEKRTLEELLFHIARLREVVYSMLDVYTSNDWLNEKIDIVDIIPMSLDEWIAEIDSKVGQLRSKLYE